MIENIIISCQLPNAIDAACFMTTRYGAGRLDDGIYIGSKGLIGNCIAVNQAYSTAAALAAGNADVNKCYEH